MIKRKFWFNQFLSASLVFAAASYAADLDVDGARSRYQDAQSRANSAKSRFESRQSVYNRALAEVRTAEGRESSARANVSAARKKYSEIETAISRLQTRLRDLDSQTRRDESELRRVEGDISRFRSEADSLKRQSDDLGRQIDRVNQRIRQLERQGGSGNWTCNYVDRGWEEHRGGHPATHANKQTAMKQAEAACKAHHDRCRLASCRQPPSQELKRAKQRRDRLVREKRTVDSNCDQAISKLKRATSKARGLKSAIETCRSQMADINSRLSRARQDLERQRWAIGDAERDLNQKVAQTSQARGRAESARRSYLSAKSDYDSLKAAASRAYAYLQQVIENYNRALQAVYAKAEAAAKTHAMAEANQRATDVGFQAGVQTARAVGTEKGVTAGVARDKVLGYQEGRSQASTDVLLKALYQSGQTKGKNLATLKARLENFPKGYNEALANLLASVPAGEAEIDISELLPEDEGDGGNILLSTPKSIGSKSGPNYPIPSVPTAQVPTYQSPSVEVPAASLSQSNPPCTNLELVEFGPKCRDRYTQTYRSEFVTAYRAIYLRENRRGFDESVQAAFDQALEKKQVAAFDEGRNQAAEEQGELDGFQTSLTDQIAKQFGLGKAQLATDLESGYLVVYREAKLLDENEDGITSPGEKLKLSIVVDNYGKKSSLKGKLRVRLTGLDGLKETSVLTRELPSLAAESRTTLLGVISTKVASELAGAKVGLSATVEIERDGRFVELGTLKVGETVHFPLELSAIELPKKPAINEEVLATLTFTNHSKKDLGETPLQFWTAPEFVKVLPDQALKIPALASGQSAEVEAKIKPLFYVGENTQVNFKVRTEPEGLDGKIDQSFPKTIHMNRAASLLLFDKNGKAIPNSTLTVNAGSWASFQIQFKYHLKVQSPGPFQVRRVRTSDSAMSLPDGTTVGVTLGSWWPGRTAERMPFHYFIPKSLKGKKVWAMFEVNQGGTSLHVLMVYINVK